MRSRAEMETEIRGWRAPAPQLRPAPRSWSGHGHRRGGGGWGGGLTRSLCSRAQAWRGDSGPASHGSSMGPSWLPWKRHGSHWHQRLTSVSCRSRMAPGGVLRFPPAPTEAVSSLLCTISHDESSIKIKYCQSMHDFLSTCSLYACGASAVTIYSQSKKNQESKFATGKEKLYVSK